MNTAEFEAGVAEIDRLLTGAKLRDLWVDVLNGGFDPGSARCFLLTFASIEAMLRMVRDEPDAGDRVGVRRLDFQTMKASFPKNPNVIAEFERNPDGTFLVGTAVYLPGGQGDLYTMSLSCLRAK